MLRINTLSQQSCASVHPSNILDQRIGLEPSLSCANRQNSACTATADLQQRDQQAALYFYHGSGAVILEASR